MSRHRSYQLSFPPWNLKLETVSDPDALLDTLVAKEDNHEDILDERIPYWAELWSSAVALAGFLAENRLVQDGMVVHEIGCGLGLPGVLAGLMGGELIFSDYLPEAVAFARHNWLLNLDRPAQFQVLDWRQPDSRLAADLVLASDVAYEKRFFAPLPKAFDVLCKPRGRVLLSEPGRAMAQEFLDSFEALGFSVIRHQRSGQWEGLDYQVGIYELIKDKSLP